MNNQDSYFADLINEIFYNGNSADNQKLNPQLVTITPYMDSDHTDEFDYHLDRSEVQQICEDHCVKFSDLLADVGNYKNYSHNEIFTWLGY